MSIFTKEEIQNLITDEYISQTWDVVANDPRGVTLTPDQYQLSPYHRLIYHTFRKWKIGKVGTQTALISLEDRVINLQEDPHVVVADILTKISEFFQITDPPVLPENKT
jgi:hypothetical protein